MFERRNPEVNSGQIGQELLSIYHKRQESIDRSDQLIEEVTDTPEKTAAEFAQSYYETFYDTPAKQMLWNAEYYIPKVEQFGKTYSRLRHFDSAILSIDVAEAYATVMPDEGWRVIQAMPDSREKIEALAKFGVQSDPIFIEQARRLAYALDPTYLHARHNSLMAIADFGSDDYSLELAHKEAVAYLNSTDKEDGWDIVDYFTDEASLGHARALLLAKKFILQNLDHAGTNRDHCIEEMALISYIDELVNRGHIPVRLGLEPTDMMLYESVEANWQDALMKNVASISSLQKAGIELPRFDALYRSLHMLHSQARDYTDLKTGDAMINYIDAQANAYAQRLMAEKDLDALEDLHNKTDQIDRSHLLPHKEHAAKVEAFRKGRDYAMIASIIGRRTVEEEIEIENLDASHMLAALNKIGLIRGLCLAGVGLNSVQA